MPVPQLGDFISGKNRYDTEVSLIFLFTNDAILASRAVTVANIFTGNDQDAPSWH